MFRNTKDPSSGSDDLYFEITGNGSLIFIMCVVGVWRHIPPNTDHLLTYLLTYLLPPWSRVLLKKLTGSAASQEIPRIFGTRMFITVLTSARHLSLSWANSIQSPQPPLTSWRSILILSSYLLLGLPNGLFPSDFPTRTLYTDHARDKY